MNLDSRARTALVLGTGASRAVSHANLGGIPSPLDSDFFDLLQRLEPHERDQNAVKTVLHWASEPRHVNLRNSMERLFYTLHLRSYIARKLFANRQRLDTRGDHETLYPLAPAGAREALEKVEDLLIGPKRTQVEEIRDLGSSLIQ
jgi:hypothetical protein